MLRKKTNLHIITGCSRIAKNSAKLNLGDKRQFLRHEATAEKKTHQVRSGCMTSRDKVKSVVEFQGEKYINSKIILFCGVIEFLINHSLIHNKTSHNLFI